MEVPFARERRQFGAEYKREEVRAHARKRTGRVAVHDDLNGSDLEPYLEDAGFNNTSANSAYDLTYRRVGSSPPACCRIRNRYSRGQQRASGQVALYLWASLHPKRLDVGLKLMAHLDLDALAGGPRDTVSVDGVREVELPVRAIWVAVQHPELGLTVVDTGSVTTPVSDRELVEAQPLRLEKRRPKPLAKSTVTMHSRKG